MLFLNRLQIFIKRMLASKLYIFTLLCLIGLSIIYILLPVKKRSTDIKVALYMEESDYSDKLWEMLSSSNSVYDYYQVYDKKDAISDVESGKAECGFYIPADFYDNYINGIYDVAPIIEYSTASTTLGKTISENIFSQIFKLCSDKILYLACDMPEYNDELKQRLDDYINGDRVFQIEDHSADHVITEDITYKLRLPIYELSFLLIVFSGLLGLLMYVRDSEKGYYIALDKTGNFSAKLSYIVGANVITLLTSICCCLVTYGVNENIFKLILVFICITVLDIFPGCFIKKSSSLVKLLPVIMLILTALQMILSIRQLL